MAPTARDVIATCPVCAQRADGDAAPLRRVRHHAGGALQRGSVRAPGQDQLALLESFLRARGNLRDMERELGISYPTVRNRVEALVRALGLADRPGAAGGCRRRRRSGDSGVARLRTPGSSPPSGGGSWNGSRARSSTPEDAAAILRALGGTEVASDG